MKRKRSPYVVCLPAYGRDADGGAAPGPQIFLLDASCVVEGSEAASLPLCRIALHAHEYLWSEALQGVKAFDGLTRLKSKARALP